MPFCVCGKIQKEGEHRNNSRKIEIYYEAKEADKPEAADIGLSSVISVWNYVGELIFNQLNSGWSSENILLGNEKMRL